MELIHTIMLNVIVLVFFAAILDLLLPAGSFRSYIKMAMGFFAVLTMLQPVLQFWQQDHVALAQQMVQAGQMAVADAEYSDDWQAQTNAYQEQYTAQIEAQYAAQTAQQIKSLLLLNAYPVTDVQCGFVPVMQQETERQLQVWIQLQGDKSNSQQIQSAISGYFGLELAQVQVEWTNNEEVQ